MGKAQAVQAQLDALNDWIVELDRNLDADLDRVVPFDYSPDLAAAMDLHGIEDPNTAWSVFSKRAEALTGLLERL